MTNNKLNSLNNQQNLHSEDIEDNFETQKSIDFKFIENLDSEVVFLPENDLLDRVSNENNNFLPFTKDLLFEMKGNGVNASLYDDGKDKRSIELRSADFTHFQYLIFPTMVFLDKFAIPVALGLLSNWIYNKWIQKDNSSALLKIEYARFDGEKIIDWRKIEGTAKDVHNVLLEDADFFNDVNKKIDRNKLMRDLDVLSSENAHKKLAEDSIANANYLIKKGEFAFKRKKIKEAESYFRKSLHKIREATQWNPNNPRYKQYLYEIGAKIHDNFGCPMKIDKESNMYKIDCPVRLSNFKGGFSPGMTIKEVCSICGENSLDCSHINGQLYDNVIARKEGKHCSICFKKECEHVVGNEYDNIKAFSIATKIEMDHISLVDKPYDPRCGIIQIELPKSDVLEMIPEEERETFVYGQLIHCHLCVI
ncbi:hypothetical protein [Methanobacterium sp.]|uniref:hypothetical protein n=1 Tax=Methanobacterium sp. TaxID=2164 RepID=UPI003C75FBE7